ncbi:MAG: hypothetical protein SFY32_03615 [Bacteroidota bacterium]|nr:hypothetical protein [Bacteroidota bacterium]
MSISKSIFTFLILYFIVFNIHAQISKKTEPIKGIMLSLPPSFVTMTDDEIASKFPTYKKPLAMFVSQDKTADFGINVAVNRWQNKNLIVLRDMYKSTISSIFSEIDYKIEGDIVKINNREFILFEFTSKYTDENNKSESTIALKNYSYIAYTLYNQKILIFNFTSTYGESGKWAAVANSLIKSIEITDKLELKEFEPYQVNRPQPKGTEGDPQMKIIKQMKKKPGGN